MCHHDIGHCLEKSQPEASSWTCWLCFINSEQVSQTLVSPQISAQPHNFMKPRSRSLLERQRIRGSSSLPFFKQQSMQQWYYVLFQFNVTQCTILKSDRFIFLRDTTCVFDRWSSHFWHKVGQSWESFETSNWSIYQWELMMVNPFVCCLCNEYLNVQPATKKYEMKKSLYVWIIYKVEWELSGPLSIWIQEPDTLSTFKFRPKTFC